MDPLTQNIITNLATNYFASFTVPTIQSFFHKVFELKPNLENDLKSAVTTHDFEKVFAQAIGVIDATAGTGKIDIDSSFIEALRGIRFDHENGSITIQGSNIQSNILETGGTGMGNTYITNSSLKTNGTEIRIGQGASIRISGNASIRQN